ncbi:MAG TPA: hypothetical protein VFX70_12515 [Mycobacteriales bacterium]|nr:hypothetical protein [Mycobacteriales bacterium]
MKAVGAGLAGTGVVGTVAGVARFGGMGALILLGAFVVVLVFAVLVFLGRVVFAARDDAASRLERLLRVLLDRPGSPTS